MKEAPPIGPFPSLADIEVHSVMSTNVVSCPRGMELHEVATIMAREGIHSVVVEPDPGTPGQEWSVISDRDLLNAHVKPHSPAWSIASSPTLTIKRDASLIHAVRLMVEFTTTHLVVVGHDDRPAGMISTLDIMREMSEVESGAA